MARVLGGYLILEEIAFRGRGAYRARDPAGERDVAILVLPPEALPDEAARRRALARVRAYSRVDHPSVAAVLELGHREGVDYVVAEHVTGVSLAEKRAGGPLPAPLVETLARQLLEGLAAVHAAGLVHGAVTAERLVITPDLRLKLLDPAVPEPEDGLPRDDLRAAAEALAAVMDEPSGAAPAAERSGGEPLRVFLRRCAAADDAGAFESAAAALAALPHMEAAAAPPLARSRSRFRRPRLVHALAGGAALAALPFAIVALNLDRPILRWTEPRNRIDSIAVLPLESEAGDEARIFADGFGDALIMSLSRVGGLQVISRTSAMRYRDSQLSLSRIAAELGVDAVVEGSVTRSEDQVRVSVRLVDALTRRELWTATYDRDAADVPQLQGEVAADIVRKVAVQVTPEERYRIRRSRVVDPAAHEAYLQGHHHLERRTPNGLEVGLRYLQRAVETDPDYALAWAGLANGYALLASTGYDGMAPRDAMPEARRAAERAVALDDQLAETHTALAQVLNNHEWNWVAAERSFRRAIELGPGFSTARQWYGFHLAATGRLDGSLDMMERALALDPLSPLACTSVGRIRYYRGELDGAVASFERALELDPHFLPAYILLGLAHVARGENEAALASFERGRDLFAGAPAFAAGLGAVHAAAGRRTEAMEAIATLDEARGRRYVPAIYTAAIHAKLGRDDDAFAWLDRAVEERSEAITFLAVEPIFAGLHGDPRFAALLARMGLPDARLANLAAPPDSAPRSAAAE